jgi:hypothetical protein
VTESIGLSDQPDALSRPNLPVTPIERICFTVQRWGRWDRQICLSPIPEVLSHDDRHL